MESQVKTELSKASYEEGMDVNKMEIENLEIASSIIKNKENLPNGDLFQKNLDKGKKPQSRSELSISCVNVKTNKNKSKRMWDKKVSCIFCNKLITNFTRHLIRNHSNEIEVAKIIAYPKGAKERKFLFERLRKKGNFYHNSNCLQEKSGSIIVEHRPSTTKPVENYLPCKHCFGFFFRKRLYRHMKICASRLLNQDRSSRNAQSAGVTMLFVSSSLSEDLCDKVLKYMRDDLITQEAKNDDLICEYGSRLLSNHTEKHLNNTVSQKMRELARLVLVVKSKQNTIENLTAALTPTNYKLIVTCVKELAGYKRDGSFKTPTVVTKLGHSLRQCTEILQCRGLVTNNSILEQSAKNFSFLLSKQWQYDISSNDAKSLNTLKCNKPILLPLAKDIQSLHTLIVEKERELQLAVRLNPKDRWGELCEITILHVILLNRRRIEEVERIKVQHYKERDKKSHNMEQSLTDVEKTLCSRMTRFETRGKRCRCVPVLLTQSMKNSFDLLLSTREVADVHPFNPNMFAVPNSETSTLRVTDVVRKYAALSGVKEPGNLISAQLRKYVATMTQILNLTTTELEQLAQFMGHDLSKDKEFYRLPENMLHVAKVSKLLLMMEKGKFKNLSGKGLNDVQLNIDHPVSDNEENSEDEGDETTYPLESEGRGSSRPLNLPEPENVNLQKQFFPKLDNETGQPNMTRKKPEQSVMMRKPCKKTPWSQKEKEAVLRHFSKHIILKQIPKKDECEKCLKVESDLKARQWKHVKFFVKNKINKI